MLIDAYKVQLLQAGYKVEVRRVSNNWTALDIPAIIYPDGSCVLYTPRPLKSEFSNLWYSLDEQWELAYNHYSQNE